MTFDSKIKELEKEKSELDLSFLETKKQGYQQRIIEILEKQTDGVEDAEKKLEEMRRYHQKIKEIDYKIEHKDEILKKIEDKIKTCKERKEWVKTLKLYRETEEGIAEIFGQKIVKHAKETNNEDLMKKLRTRTIKLEEYIEFLPKEYSEFLDLDNQDIKAKEEKEKEYSKIFSKIIKKEEKKKEAQATQKATIKLPEGMPEKIKEILKDSKDFTIEEIEKFLKKILKKLNGEIMISHIKTKFGDRTDKATNILKEIIADYSEFKITENSDKETNKKTTSKKSKNEKLIATINTSSQHGKEASKNQLLNKLTIIGEETNLGKRIDSYIEILERLGHKFSDKQSFKDETAESIETQTSIQIEEGIIRALKKIIEGTLILRKTEAYGYRSYELGENCDNRRILLYPNKEIMKICSHPEYENIIDSRPPADKR